MNLRIIYLVLLGLLTSLFGEGFSLGFTAFLIPSMLMGLGIAIDVYIGTISQFQNEHLSWKNWTLPVTLTHVTFPACGYYLFWGLSEAFPVTKLFLGLVGFLLVTLFLYEVISEAAGKEPFFGLSAWIGKKFGFAADDARRIVAILAVSWDALWSGPAKAAQAIAGNWSGHEVLISFMIAGVVVALVAESALFSAYILRKIRFKKVRSLTNFTITGMYIELSVIGGFGILSLWSAFSHIGNLYDSLTISALVLFTLFVVLWKPLYETQLEESTEIIAL